MDAAALLLLAGVWVFDVIALSPLLLFGATKRLLADRPTDYLVANHVLAATGYAVVHVLVAFAPGIATGTVGGGWLVAATFGLLGGSWIALAVVVPRLGWWNPAERDGWDGRLALGTVAFGYLGFLAAAALFAVLGLLAVFARYPS